MTVEDTYDIAVVGAGMMGSAAAKYLAAEGMKTLLIGPSEGNQAGVHSSHHDEARITRITGPDMTWSHLAAASIERYAHIEHASGIRFHKTCGHLRCDLPERYAHSRISAVRSVVQDMSSTAEEFDHGHVQVRFPYLQFTPESLFHYEPAPSGIINPRLLVRAQQSIGKQHGLVLLRDVVTAIRRSSRQFYLTTTTGILKAERLLIAAGSYSALMDLLPKKPVFSVRPETVLLVRIDEERARDWSDMPGIIWNFNHHPEVPYAYVLPPVRYPDGFTYIKIGADHDKDVDASSVAAFDAYMRGEGSQHTARLLYGLVQVLLPDLQGAPWRSKPCMLTYTGHGYPYIDTLQDGWFIAAGGCGQSAKSSDQIGYLASRMILDEPWPEAFDHALFRLRWHGSGDKMSL